MQINFLGSVFSNKSKYNTAKAENTTVSNPNVTLNSQPQQDEFKRITKGQINDIKKYPQFARSDCYLVASLKALAKSGFGKQMLKNSISSNQDKTSFNVQFKRYKADEKNTYNVNRNSEYNAEAYEVATGRPDFRTIGAVEKATSDINGEKSSTKPWYIRTFGKYDTNLEGNEANYFMYNLTGVKPISLGDSGLKSLSSANKEEAIKLLDKIGELPMNRHSFVCGSKIFGTKNVGKSHYYILNKVDNNICKLDAGSIEMINKINLPNVKINLDEYIADLQRFNGNVVIQTLFVRGTHGNDVLNNTSDEEIESWLQHLKKINPRKTMIYVIDRETPEKNLEKISAAELSLIANKVKALDLDVEYYE